MGTGKRKLITGQTHDGVRLVSRAGEAVVPWGTHSPDLFSSLGSGGGAGREEQGPLPL